MRKDGVGNVFGEDGGVNSGVVRVRSPCDPRGRREHTVVNSVDDHEGTTESGDRILEEVPSLV